MEWKNVSSLLLLSNYLLPILREDCRSTYIPSSPPGKALDERFRHVAPIYLSPHTLLRLVRKGRAKVGFGTVFTTGNHSFPLQKYDKSLPVSKPTALFFRSFHSFQQFSVFLLHNLSTSSSLSLQRQVKHGLYQQPPFKPLIH